MAEQLICNQQVVGSTPITSSIKNGGIPERPKGADCKSVVTDFAGPNPASPTIKKDQPQGLVFFYAEEADASNSVTKSSLCRIPRSGILPGENHCLTIRIAPRNCLK